MKRKLKIFGKIISALLASLTVAGVIAGYVDEKKNGKDANNGSMNHKPHGVYEVYFKRPFDFICGMLALIVFWPLYLVIAVIVRIKLGHPVLFTQDRPGQDEKIFKIYKFRTMADERNENGELLPDEDRLSGFGKWLRSTSLDELPEAFNIIKGDLSIVGPRPQLVHDMVFMSDKQRRRHTVKPGLTGLAQVNGRNNISWEDKLEWDLKYIDKITFHGDLKIIFQTVMKALIRHDGITEGDMATAEDFGDYLLARGKVDKDEYDKRQAEAEELLQKRKHLQY